MTPTRLPMPILLTVAALAVTLALAVLVGNAGDRSGAASSSPTARSWVADAFPIGQAGFARLRSRA